MKEMFKPFKPPSFVRRPSGDPRDSPSAVPLPKRQRVDDGGDKIPSVKAAAAIKEIALQEAPQTFRQPLKLNRVLPNAPTSLHSDNGDAYYNALWRKPTTKKNKIWDGDGVLRVSGGTAYLQDSSGKQLGKAPCHGPLLPGSSLKLAGREVEIESLLSREEYVLLRQSTKQQRSPLGPNISDEPSSQAGFLERKAVASVSRVVSSTEKAVRNPKNSVSRHFEPSAEVNYAISRTPAEGERKSRPIETISLLSPSSWKNPVRGSTVVSHGADSSPTPRHDPNAPDALVMNRPAVRDVPKGKRIVDVVVDPILSKKLRPHQREGVKFLYDCIIGTRSDLGQGAILADEMGLGKTLQTITLIWTLLKQSPIHGDDPVIRKALIVCPVTLTKNWRKEFRKWLGNERIGVFLAGDKNTRLTDFTRGRSYNVMIIGYERLRAVYEELQKGQNIDLIVADEGHRLKTTQSKLAQAVQTLSAPRRIILSGTPIQNDLGEFFSMVDFVNPGALGTLKAFTRNFEMPIERSRQPHALDKDVEKGKAKGDELAEITSPFILRRTADVLSEYLPGKTECVLLCRPTAAQASVYKHVLASPIFQSALGSAENALQLITILKKVCNSPKLLAVDPSIDAETAALAPAVAASIPPKLLRNASASSKLRVIDQLLSAIHDKTEEKVVVVSNFTSTLDMLESLLASLSMTYLRLDGSTPSSKRQDLVDTFNRSDRSSCFAFLLSAKAGGVGLNLIGASRLILFDVDWNPSVDMQAMARIHRDGQKRPCFIYRLLLAGALDEKIWQRQVTKLSLASSVLESKSGQSSFTKEELRDLFRLDEGMKCQTHELIGCNCGGRLSMQEAAVSQELPAESQLLEPTEGRQGIESNTEPGNEDTDSELDLMPVRKRRDIQHAIFPSQVQVIPASQVDMDVQEKTYQNGIARKPFDKPGSMDLLMTFAHLDTQRFNKEGDGNTLINDELLREVLCDEDSLVNFVFCKTSK